MLICIKVNMIFFQALFARIVWILSVVTGFVGAGYLVGRSISTWMSSPVMITITIVTIITIIIKISTTM